MSVTRIEKPSFAKQLQMCFSAFTSAANPAGQLLLLKKPVLPNNCKCRKAGWRGCCQTGTHKSKWGRVADDSSKQTNKQTNKSGAERLKIAASRRKKTEAMGLEMQSGQY